MAQRSISSFFFKGAAAVGAGAVAPDANAPVVDTHEVEPVVPSETLKRKRDVDELSHQGEERRRCTNAVVSILTEASDAHGGVSRLTTDAPSGDVQMGDDVLGQIPTLRDLAKRDAMRKKLGEATSTSESKHQTVRERFKWLEKGNIVDQNGKKPGDPNYDHRTVTIPPDLKLSASQTQYWSIKQKYRDVVLFFKVGKFYELYEDDAEIGCAALDWKMTVSGVGHCRQVGCPESGIDTAVAQLVNLGYKVGRIEQMETAAQAKERCQSKTAVIRRELMGVMTPSCVVDGDLTGQAGKIPQDALHVLALAEGIDTEINENKNTTTVGYAFLDAASGVLRVGSFADDASRVGVHTLLTQIAPVEIVIRRGEGTSSGMKHALSKFSQSPKMCTLDSNEFPSDSQSADTQLKTFSKCSENFSKQVEIKITGQHTQTRCAVNALASHLGRLHCQAPLLAAKVSKHKVYALEKLRLDGPTVTNLELLCGADGNVEGSLLSKLDSCVTAGGSRVMRRWIAAPLRDVDEITKRQDAVAWFGGFEGDEFLTQENESFNGADRTGRLRRALRRVPDLERGVGRTRAASALSVSDQRALPEHLANTRHKKRVASLAAAVTGARDVIRTLQEVASFDSCQTRAPELIRQLVGVASVDSLTENGAQQALDTAYAALDWGSKASGAAKTAAATAAAAAAAAPALKSTRSLVTQERAALSVESSLEVLSEAETELGSLLEQFLKHAVVWSTLAACANQLDALSSLAAFASTGDGPMCRPVFVTRERDDGPSFSAQKLWHPCAVTAAVTGSINSRNGSNAVVPNDVDLGREGKNKKNKTPAAVLLTGPNMGGKSTLLRATCIAVVLSQMGAPCPSSCLTLSPVDTIFTRLGGAGDRLDAGESTFLVECSEAASILNGATRDSLVVLDELGRGTSTFDGFAVAFACFAQLAHVVGCRLLFATHYHALSREFEKSPCVQLKHMGADVGEETETGSNNSSNRQITFLYKLEDGACPKSYGTSVAALAGVPEAVLVKATEAACEMEERLAGVFGDKSASSINAKLTAGEVELLKRTLRATTEKTLQETWLGLTRQN